MVKKVRFLIIPFIALLTNGFSQTPGKFIYENKEYYVYPFRSDNSDGVPLVGSSIPDGDYVIFENYDFKKKFSLKRKKTYVLKDTTVVNALITIKNNVANGPAVFYTGNSYRRGKKRRRSNSFKSGNFVNGLKDGVWKESSAGSSFYTLTNYRNGLRHGYEEDYSGKYLMERKKYCNGDECDTVFRYRSNRLYEEYDICLNKDLKIEPGIYTDALAYIPSYIIGQPKTYLKLYDYDGKITLDLKFDHGSVLPFDSIGYSRYYGALQYVTVKTIGNNHQLITAFDSSSYGKRIDRAYYADNFMYRQTTEEFRIKNRKKLFGKSRKIKILPAKHKESIYVDPKKIDFNSVAPVLISGDYDYYDTTASWYIPKYKFRYQDRGDVFFHHVDTGRQWVYLNHRTGFSNKSFTRTDLDVYIEEAKNILLTETYNPSMQKDYILNYEFESAYISDMFYNGEQSQFAEESFTRQNIESVYSSYGVPLNGNYEFSESKKPKKKMAGYTHVGSWNYDTDYLKGNLVNGKKEGDWKFLNSEKTIRKTPANYYTWFFKHPKSAVNYTEAHYKNGLMDGKYISYEKEVVSHRQNPKRSEIKLYKKDDGNYTRDTLNGPYKSYFFDGKTEKEGNYDMGRPDGTWTEYYRTGEVYTTTGFDKGKLHGKYIKYSSGTVTLYGNFSNNRLKDSLVYYYYNTHKPMLCIYAHNDTLTKRVSYFNNGQLKEQLLFDVSSSYKLNQESISSESFIEILSDYGNNDLRNASGQFKNYYDNGQVLSEGAIKNGALNGPWTFYSINGVAIHKVNFADTVIMLPEGKEPVEIAGFYTGYYVSGKKRCEGYIKDIDLSFDCFTKQDKANLDFYITAFYDADGKQTVTNGTGQVIKFDPNGSRMAMGRLVNCIEDSLWRYYTPDQKLTEIGHYVNGQKDGVWYIGDLEGINFEDGACFDLEDPDAKKAYLEKQKELNINQIIYQNGEKIQTFRFNSDLNKVYKPKRGHHSRSVHY